ncbi:glycosyltransferase [Sporomusa acidovorans]|uniref:Glycosyltransferase EpsD n=1 Tax=Sporomusa acidovorans (strain ATCC 49682 / DSM 3132 / Mol) TaxID=1123286 RepID=A0ABZ3IYU1_SPOA4|nr:glycosyltransferase [Sporomusa acidovorans]OZC17239.1 putative glycosyltransferase EpsD [Sporomusa acidovorans DSM 3132]SDF15436.1 Glycosyltransferase involved in cell wall bisynthesis [Sporomusa acidovorans]
MKKVLLLAPMSSVHERFNKVNINILKDLQCEIHIAANFEHGTNETIQHNLRYKKQIEYQGIVVHQMPFQRSSLIKNLAVIKICRELFKKEKFDMIHAHTETGGLITRIAMSSNSTTKYVFTPHGMSFYKGSSLKSWMLYYPIEKWICDKMVAVMAMNQEELEVLKKWNKNNERYIHGIGFDVNAIQKTIVNKNVKRAELGIPQESFLILSIGELNENKNHETIIRALAKIKAPNLYYLICGEGHLKSYLEDICNSYNLSNKIIFAGYRRDISEIVHIADLFAFASYHEGLPVSVMEAMAAGLPIVCSKIRGNIDLLEDGKGGYLCKPGDVDSFAEKLNLLIYKEEQRKKMARTNLENIQKFSKDVVYVETNQIYREILM